MSIICRIKVYFHKLIRLLIKRNKISFGERARFVQKSRAFAKNMVRGFCHSSTPGACSVFEKPSMLQVDPCWKIIP
ncbi:uncharacterized protein [Gossypium hirsutum]|uniref:Uncharacterized protein isoform X2 n=1 Tax=Gossypium hirsutum TaxID=3635 RepID=A0ABM3BD33_GOSHI|nr:uncharacterized protein LOC107920560 isoform X2 [Gossypium hirsutum]